VIDKKNINVDKGFYRRRRGVYEHMEIGSLGWLDIAIHDWLCGHAKAVMNKDKYPAGVWLGSVRVMWDKAGRDPNVSLRQLQRHVLKLEKLGYFRRFTVNKTTDAFVMHKLIVSDLTQTDYVVNAEETTDWTQPKYEAVANVTPTRRTDDVDVSSSCRTDDVQLCPMNETYETEETGETVETEETTSPVSAPVATKSPAKVKVQNLTLAELPDSHFLTEPPGIKKWSLDRKQAWYQEKNLRAERAKRTLPATESAPASTSTQATSGQPKVLDDIRDWDEPRFNISGERLRNCIIYQLDHAKDDYFRKSEITLASMNREKFINLLNENTPTGWNPETRGKKKVTTPSKWVAEDAV
jgi:hypothetical protein